MPAVAVLAAAWVVTHWLGKHSTDDIFEIAMRGPGCILVCALVFLPLWATARYVSPWLLLALGLLMAFDTWRWPKRGSPPPPIPLLVYGIAIWCLPMAIVWKVMISVPLVLFHPVRHLPVAVVPAGVATAAGLTN